MGVSRAERAQEQVPADRSKTMHTASAGKPPKLEAPSLDCHFSLITSVSEKAEVCMSKMHFGPSEVSYLLLITKENTLSLLWHELYMYLKKTDPQKTQISQP